MIATAHTQMTASKLEKLAKHLGNRNKQVHMSPELQNGNIHDHRQ
jgi:hypothetical protein